MEFFNIHSSYLNNNIKYILNILIDNKNSIENLVLIKKLQTDNLKLFKMLTTFVILIQDENGTMNIEELEESVYYEFRKIYKMFNQEFDDLSPQEIEQSKKMVLNKNNFQDFENLIVHFGKFNKLFKDISNLNTSQYQDLDIIANLLEQTQKLLKISQLEPFKSQLNQINLLKPYITNQISLIQKDINHHLVKVNEICNNKPTLKDLYKSYQSECNLMLNNFDKLKENINPQIISNNRNLRNIKNLGDR